jgi:hypothetical protein
MLIIHSSSDKKKKQKCFQKDAIRVYFCVHPSHFRSIQIKARKKKDMCVGYTSRKKKTSGKQLDKRKYIHTHTHTHAREVNPSLLQIKTCVTC